MNLVSGVARRAALAFLPLVLVAAGVLYLIYRAQIEASWTVTRTNEEKVIQVAREVIHSVLYSIGSDVLFLSEQESLRRWLASGSAQARDGLARTYLAFVTHKTIYDQVRFIDLDGQEIVRVDWNNGKPSVISQEQLQNKSDRPYVQETLALGRGEIFQSPFDLNIERGEIEQPLKPMIRFGTPVFDGQGRKRGIVIVNYLGDRLLARIRKFDEGTPGEIQLLNTEGHWLLGRNADDAWTFMFPERKSHSFAHSYPDAWDRIHPAVPPFQFFANGDLFTFVRVFPREQVGNIHGSGVRWILLTHVTKDELSALTAPIERSAAFTAVLSALLLAAASWITARHRIAREQSERAIRQSEARFRTLLESAPDAVVIIDKDGQIVFANAQVETLFGYPRERLLRQPIEILVPQRHRGGHIGHRNRYLANPAVRPMGSGLELHGVRKDGSEFPITVSLSPIEIEGEINVFCDVRDITEQRKSELRINELNERLKRDNVELESLNKELEAFSYSVSHDLRAPLRAIDGFSQALLEDSGKKLDEDGKNDLGRIRKAAQRMGTLIDDLIKLAHVTRMELRVEDVDLSHVAGEIVDELKQTAPQREGEFIIAPALHMQGDPRLMRIALENLLNNAWKFTAERKPARIEFGRTDHNGSSAYYVRDNGAGFDMAYSSKLFGAFQRLHDARVFPGTGIGLATVQRIIRKHGGRIWADAAADKGATFYFTL